jgi:predicted permease
VSERLAESAWLGIAGGALGLALSLFGVRLLRLWIGSFESARRAADVVHLDGRALLFAILVSLATPVVFGLVPALAVSKPNPAHALHQAPGWKRPRRGPYGGRDLLVIAEIGLAVVLVVATGMFARFFAELDRVEWGFDPAQVLAADLSFGRGPDRRAGDSRLMAEIVEGARHLPGVLAAEVGEPPDLPRRSDGSPVEFEGCATASGMRPARTLNVGPDYFAALGLPVRRGRGFTAQDTAGSPAVGVISEAHATGCWPGQDPVGHRFRPRRNAQTPWITIVGVVPDVMKTRLLPEAPQPVYLPYAQHDALPSSLLLRSDRDPAVLAGAVRALVRRVDPTQPLDRLEPLDERFRQRTGGTSLLTGILGGFSAFALALGTLGVFSVVSYMVAERTREFGIRIALGASRRDILRLVLSRAGHPRNIFPVGAATILEHGRWVLIELNSTLKAKRSQKEASGFTDLYLQEFPCFSN